MKRIVDNQRGAFLVIFAIALMVLLAFLALAIEGGRWYLVRAELSKSVDAAALAGANNISNPYIDPRIVARDFGTENFQAGYVGTPGSGAGTVNFVATSIDNDKISVTGNVTAVSVLAQMFGVSSVPVSSTGIGQKKEVEIMMILDRSGSMSTGGKMAALKSAALNFLAHFQDTQDKDKLGVISYANTVRFEWDLGTNYYTSANIAKINALTASGGTNMESALDAADGWTDRTSTINPSTNIITTATGTTHAGFTDQTGIPGDQRVQQFVVQREFPVSRQRLHRHCLQLGQLQELGIVESLAESQQARPGL
jgi:Flp pilus assembly protein TadG